ncbi:hypothetical protein VSDG_05291 [Cytospora chrysosperma]|uniref:Condensation domain-containing protein n=1 Tax=Cytospora chrysosperma TaxID=252740 RepID=A0A423VWV8_CYTCH|nr:hypothetical protein VSDG_05291 [Valsa sordida]
MYMQCLLNPGRLAWAYNTALQRNDAYRTSFFPDPKKILRLRIRSPLSKGDTLKVVAFHWSPTDHLLIIAYHRLVGDGWTTECLFVEAGQLYSGVQLEPAPSYADFAIRKRKQMESGEFDKELDYWAELYKTLRARLPTLDLPGAKPSAVPTSWTEHELSARLNRVVGVRIKDHSREENQDQAESGDIGDARIVGSRTLRASSPYDVTLEIIDDSIKDALITVKLNKELYWPKDAEMAMDVYVSTILSIFSKEVGVES